jgi:hypothetical protein
LYRRNKGAICIDVKKGTPWLIAGVVIPVLVGIAPVEVLPPEDEPEEDVPDDPPPTVITVEVEVPEDSES